MTLSWLNKYNLLIFDRIDSTNSEAIRIAKSQVNGNFLIVARKQTSGRGQKNKEWESLDGNLHASILLQSTLNINKLKELPFLVAIALKKALKIYVHNHKDYSKIKLKWPNDLMFGHKKLAGILLESININNKNYVIIGVGVNTHFVPNIKDRECTSLFNEGIILKNADDFLNNFIVKFDYCYEKWKNENSFDTIKKEWIKNAYRLNEKIVFNNTEDKITGIFRGIDCEGRICIEQNNGLVMSFSSGSIISY